PERASRIATSSNRRSEAPRPATHCHFRASRWSSNRTSALTTVGFISGHLKGDPQPHQSIPTPARGWGSGKARSGRRAVSRSGVGRLPGGDERVKGCAVGGALHLFAQAAVAEQFGDF